MRGKSTAVLFGESMSSVFSTFSAAAERFGTSLYKILMVKSGLERLWNRLNREVRSDVTRLVATDFLMCAAFGLLGLLVALWGMSVATPATGLYTYLSVYMEADTVRVVHNLVELGGDHKRTAVHPIFEMLMTPICLTLKTLGMSPIDASRAMVLVCATISGALFSAILRLMGLPRVVAGVFSALYIASAGFLFWNAVVEIYPFAAAGLLPALLLLVYARPVKTLWWSLFSALTLSFTITNWAVGLIAGAVRLDLKRFLIASLSALGMVMVLSIIQHAVFTRAAYFFNPIPLMTESTFFQPVMQGKGEYKEGWNPLNNLRSIYVTTVVAMPADVVVHGKQIPVIVATNQFSNFPKGEISPIIAVGAWLGVFGLGIWGAVTHRGLRPVSIGLAGMLLVNSLMHMIYGEVTFLYAAHFLPSLVMIAAFSWFTPARWLAVGLAVIVIICGGINNTHRLQATVDSVSCISQIPAVQKFQSWDALLPAFKSWDTFNRLHGDEVRKAYADADMDRCRSVR